MPERGVAQEGRPPIVPPLSFTLEWITRTCMPSPPPFATSTLLYTILILNLGIPLITQSDPGTENVNVAYAQTALRHHMEPSLDGSIQHRWFRKHGNIKPEIHWSVFRRDWAVGFQAYLDRGVDEGYYDIGDPLEWYVIMNLPPVVKMLINCSLVFRFIFIPFIQREVDAWVHQRNWTKRRSDRKKVLPNGIPMIILQKPHKWKAADYKVSCSRIILLSHLHM
jgi:hypothetical protein